jgi:hypothetical protein
MNDAKKDEPFVVHRVIISDVRTGKMPASGLDQVRNGDIGVKVIQGSGFSGISDTTMAS